MTRSGTARAGWLFDGSGEPARGATTLRWRDGRITGLEPAAQDAPLEESTLDLRDCTVLPALVDAHVHLFMEATSDPERRQHQLHADYQDRLPVMAAHAARQLDHGVAAVRDGGDYGGYALRYRDEAARDQSADDLRLRAAGRAWRSPGRYGRLIGRPPPEGHTLAEAVAGNEATGDHVKIAQSGVNSLKRFGWTSRPQFGIDELGAAVVAAHARGRPVMVHANGAAAVSIALEAGCDSVEHGYFATREVLGRAPELGAVWVPTLVTMWAMSESEALNADQREVARRTLDHQREEVAAAARAGVVVVAGSDAGSIGVDHGAGLWDELWLLSHAGLSTPRVVAAATHLPATLLGLEGELGGLGPGHIASFIARRGHPGELFDRAGLGPDVVVHRGALRRPWSPVGFCDNDPSGDGTGDHGVGGGVKHP